MKRLRHPVRAIREPFGTAGLIVACIALVFALTGAAFAAVGLNAKQKKEVKAIAKHFAGKPGAQGPAGPQGPAGANGKDGANGTNGAAGKSVSLVNETPLNCAEGGFTYEVEGSGVENEVCNGEQGAAGSPWVVGEAPSGATLKGTWVLPPATTSGLEEFYAPISTGVPVPAVALVSQAPKAPFCPEGSAEEPKPGLAGVLCVFVAEKTNLAEVSNGASKLKGSHGGAVIEMLSEEPGAVKAYGSWALKTP